MEERKFPFTAHHVVASLYYHLCLKYKHRLTHQHYQGVDIPKESANPLSTESAVIQDCCTNPLLSISVAALTNPSATKGLLLPRNRCTHTLRTGKHFSDDTYSVITSCRMPRNQH